MVGAHQLQASEGKKHVTAPFRGHVHVNPSRNAMPFKRTILRRRRERSWDACCTCSSSHPWFTTAKLWRSPLVQPNYALLVCIALDGVPNTSKRLGFIHVSSEAPHTRNKHCSNPISEPLLHPANVERCCGPCSMRTITIAHRGGGSCGHILPDFYKGPLQIPANCWEINVLCPSQNRDCKYQQIL